MRRRLILAGIVDLAKDGFKKIENRREDIGGKVQTHSKSKVYVWCWRKTSVLGRFRCSPKVGGKDKRELWKLVRGSRYTWVHLPSQSR